MRAISNRVRTAGLMTLLTAAAVYAESPASAPAKPVDETVVLKRGDLPLSITAEGWFEPVDAVEVKFRPKSFAGPMKVAQVAPHGSLVKSGDVVLKLNTDEIARQIAAAENELTLAQANLIKAEADVRLGEQGDELAMKIQNEALAAAEGALQWWEKVDGPHQLKRYELEVKGVTDAVGDQADELEQLRKMYKSEELTNATADIVVKRALRQLDRTKVIEQMARERTERQQATEYADSKREVVNRIDQQKQSLESLQVMQAQARTQRASALFQAKMAYEAANRKAGDLRADFATMNIAAPADGVVYYGELNGGAWQNGSPNALGLDDKVAPEQVVLTIAQPGKLKLVVPVPENEIGLLRAGDPVVATPKAFPDAQVKGQAAAPPPTATIPGESAKYEVEIAVAEADPRLRPGNRAQVKIDVPDAKGVLLVPVAAVNGGKVRVQDGEKVITKEIITGRSDGENVEVISGLEEGQRVFSTFKKD